MYRGLRIGVVIPARDEAPAIDGVVRGLLALSGDTGRVVDAIVVCDNGSRDGTGALAGAAGARVVTQPLPGYGRACLTALAALPSVDVVVFVDGDRSVIPEQALLLLDAVAAGADLAIGARPLGRVEPGALTPPQRFGNGLAVWLIRLFWGVRFCDLGPFRAIRSTALESVQMRDETYGWTVEMQVKAMQRGLCVLEVPVDTLCRLGRSKISGTLRGVIGAGIGIISMIARLKWRDRQRAYSVVATPPVDINSLRESEP